MVPVAAACGAALVFVGLNAEPPRPPQPPQPVTVAVKPTPSKDLRHRMPRSEPVRLEIPAIDVETDLLSLGVDANNEVAVPPMDRAELASWYNLGPSPGELGSAVIVGHVDSEQTGPAVFFHLGRLQPGDDIRVHRKDGTTVLFTVDDVRSFPKADFPAELVFGGADRAMLRLVTCGGEFDKRQKNYLSNIVVFANLVPDGGAVARPKPSTND